MKIQNIKQGQIFKNYKELCKALEVDIKAGKAKILQLKDFNRYFTYKKQGIKYVIDEIYEISKEKVDGRENNKGGNNRVFVDDIEKLILHILHESKDDMVSISRNRLYRKLNMINDNYIVARNNVPILSEFINLPQEAIYEFYDNSNSSLKNTVERNLKRLRSKALIMWEATTTVAIYETDIEKDILNQPKLSEGGNLLYETKLKHRVASKEEKKFILKCEKEVMFSLGCETLQKVFLLGKWRTFKKEVEKKLKEATNIQYYYDTYTITFNLEDIEEECVRLELEEVEKAKENLNTNAIKTLAKGNKTRNTSAKNKLKNSFGTIPGKEKLEYRASDVYVEEQGQLAFMLMNHKAANITKKVYKKTKESKSIESEVLAFDIEL